MMKKIYIALILISIVVCQAVVSPVYIALPPSTYGVPAEGTVSFTATLMENMNTYIDIGGGAKDQLTQLSPGCSYFVRSDGYCGIIKVECGNFQSDLSSSSIFDSYFELPALTAYHHMAVLEVSNIAVSTRLLRYDPIKVTITGGVQCFGQGANGEWEGGILPVTLSSFTATFNDGVPVLQWVTAGESNNAGWNIYRCQQDEIENSYQINPELITGQGTTTEETGYIFEDEYEIEYDTEYYYWLESIAYTGASETYGPIALQIPEDGEYNTPEVPIVYGLHKNYPNPFNPSTSISFALEEPTQVNIDIYNIKGQKVVNIMNNFVNKVDEVITVSWDGKDQNGKTAGSGIYFYQLKTNNKTQIKKMTLIK
jgi:hypothetical protein